MLKPQANATRELVSLDGIWNFALASSTDIKNDQAWTRTIPPKLQAPIPASYNDIFVDKAIRDHVGWVFYQRQVTVPRGWAGQRYFLHFASATHSARVYVDDRFVVEHAGGYTPFQVEITDLAGPSQQFRLTVAVSNELGWQSIPPGRVETLVGGKRKQHYQHDYFNYAGIARSVSLYSVPKIFIDDITVVTDVLDPTTGTVDYRVSASHLDGSSRIRVTLADEQGTVVSQMDGGKNKITIDSVHLWQPGAAYLYTLRAEILSGESSMDTYELLVGVRSVEVAGNKFLINNKPFYFTGFGKHEDAPIRGKGFDPSFMIHDYNLMAWMGANSFRTAHYPYAEEVLEYADRHGIVVINETPASGVNLGIIAGHFGLKSPPTFSPDSCNDQTRDAHAQSIKELISRDKNHASVVLWVLANEPASNEPGAREYIKPLVELTRQLDPSRPICFTNVAFATTATDLITDLFDVVCLNRYYGWYTQAGDLEAAEEVLEHDLRSWAAKYNKPIILTEYGADCQAGLHAIGDVPWSEEYQAEFVNMYHRVFDRVESVVGEHVWNFADFQCTSTTFRVDGNKKGIFTRDRRPKQAAYELKRRWKALAQKAP